MTRLSSSDKAPAALIDVVEPGMPARQGRVVLREKRDVTFSTEGLESYAFRRWEPLFYDAMVLAAAVECGDRILRRPVRNWTRRIELRVPVHEPGRWAAPALARALHDALGFLTGDRWSVEFVRRLKDAPRPTQDPLDFDVTTEAVLAYSDGMDSRAVAGILATSLGNGLVRVRVGSKRWDRERGQREPFTRVPYAVQCGMRSSESSARSRGFKFALIAAIGAYLTDAKEIVIPESGPGAIGPPLVKVGQTYPDYRNDPRFTVRMQRFVAALMGKDIRYTFPRLWHTKGETLAEYRRVTGREDWSDTRSCWRGSRWSSVNGKLRQCGVCAACMLRRVAVHAAGLEELPETYVLMDMKARRLEQGVDPDFDATKLNQAFRDYAIAGVLHMQHLADMAESRLRPEVERHATLLAPALGISREETFDRLRKLLQKHAEEWRSYTTSLGAHSYAMKWIRR